MPRLLRSSALLPEAELLQIRPQPRGSLASLAALPLDASKAVLRDHGVMVAVKAVGINFR